MRLGRVPPLSKTPASSKDAETLGQTFPAPLVLPHDALNYDPEEPAQSFRSWQQEEWRNKITTERRTLYVGAPPRINKSVSFMNEWVRPNLDGSPEEHRSKKVKKNDGHVTGPERDLQSPGVAETIEYLRAFYHGLDVKEFDIDLQWTSWAQSKKRDVRMVDGVPKFVALKYGEALTRVRARRPPDDAFPAQLNLDDILDAAIAMLPKDAYAIVLLVDHDIYESPEDDFCCGRAYGGSRVCVVQSARYNPFLDERVGIIQHHAWPMSHCKSYADELCAVEEVKPKPATTKQTRLSKTGPMRAAVDAAASLSISDGKRELEVLWFSRVARTVSHELGHCFCLAHCTYYACNMQSTAGLHEDVRQPPYLCPVCEAKISYAVEVEVESGGDVDRKRWVRKRYKALETFCESAGREETTLWSGLGAWLRSVLDGEKGEE
ncbi:hypothetical protein N0V90_000053 [Kalmusia sp. IMI 367209]|nr:hypothetical protein N0V90_000053 [Kalmusia sp. IMI 367209]